MTRASIEELKTELTQLVEKQNEVLTAQVFGTATNAQSVEWEFRQARIREIGEEIELNYRLAVGA